jgi:hypothetical protein
MNNNELACACASDTFSKIKIAVVPIIMGQNTAHGECGLNANDPNVDAIMKGAKGVCACVNPNVA